MDIHIVKEETILGPSASSIVPVASHSVYRVRLGDDSLELSFKQLKHLGETIVRIVERDELPVDIDG